MEFSQNILYKNYLEIKNIIRKPTKLEKLINDFGINLLYVLLDNSLYTERQILFYLNHVDLNKKFIVWYCLMWKNNLKEIITINHFENWYISWLWSYIFYLFLKEFTKWENKVYIENVLKSAKNFWIKIIEKYKQKWYIKQVEFVKDKFEVTAFNRIVLYKNF